MPGELIRTDPKTTGRAETFDAGREETADRLPRIGDFYWYNGYNSTKDWPVKGKGQGGAYKWLGCIMEVGSNFVTIQSPKMDGGYSSHRVHIDEIDERLTYEPDADRIIAENVAYYQGRVRALLTEINEVSNSLGFVPTTDALTHQPTGGAGLAVITTQVDTTAYKNALVKAKAETLPALFKNVEDANKSLAGWMTAPTLPMQAQIGPMKATIKQIDDRIYTIGLYAGLTEEAIKIKDGTPAVSTERLRVMQRRLYMDEECLANYDTGGMAYRDIGEFDKWLADPENYQRILPFQRCMVAFRVRRSEKERGDSGSIGDIMQMIYLREQDRQTFLYVRNGEQLWRVDCDFMFDAMIIPNPSDFDPSGEMMVQMSGSRIEKFMPKVSFDHLEAIYQKHKAWLKPREGKPKLDGEGKQMANLVYYSGDSPYYKEISGFRPGEWSPFDDTNVYYDEASAALADEIKRYNRVAVIIQGLFDRSHVLHPHPPVKVWDPVSFASSVELIYDSMVLTYGDAPDFEAYRERLNAAATPDSVWVGQEEYWERQQAAKENKRQEDANRYDGRSVANYKRFRPYGDPGPGKAMKASDIRPRAKKIVFRWRKERRYRNELGSKRSIEVPINRLLNVDAYAPGDYKMFLADTRTRADYIGWAPLLLLAEAYHAGNLDLTNEEDDRLGHY